MKICFHCPIDYFGQPSFYVRCWAPYFYNAIRYSTTDISVSMGYDTSADVVVISRSSIDTKTAQEWYSKGQKLILEFDDPMWECARVPRNGELVDYHIDFTAKTKALLKYVSGVVVSTNNLGESFIKAFGNKVPVLVMYNGVQHIATPENHNRTIFYGGCTNDKLKMFSSHWYDALEYFRKEEGYKIISSVDIPVEHEKFELCTWPQYLSNVAMYKPEIYVAPLAECEESKCKSNLKELEAWQLGAKFVGQGDPYSNSLPYNASEIDIIRAINSAKVPQFDNTFLMDNQKFIERWTAAYSGNWC